MGREWISPEKGRSVDSNHDQKNHSEIAQFSSKDFAELAASIVDNRASILAHPEQVLELINMAESVSNADQTELVQAREAYNRAITELSREVRGPDLADKWAIAEGGLDRACRAAIQAVVGSEQYEELEEQIRRAHMIVYDATVGLSINMITKNITGGSYKKKEKKV